MTPLNRIHSIDPDTGIVDVDIPAGWGVDAGRVRIVSSDPLPMEVLSITTRAVSSNGQSAGGSR